MGVKLKKNEEEKLEPIWRDRLLLESLVSQILPQLLVSKPEKVDAILGLLKNESITLSDFFQRYPEYQNLEIKNRGAIDKRFVLSSDYKQAEFFPLVNFNHSLLYHLTEEIKKRNILDVETDRDYQFQLRISLYNNFNRYLNKLLAKLDPAEAEILCLSLINIEDYQSFLSLLAGRLKMTPDMIIDNFLNSANK